jgi:tRNA(fMet)-specific endonuclease VapC
MRAWPTPLGTLIGPNDLLIAAVAVVHGVILVTKNIREFSRVGRVEGLMYDDWEA